MKNVAFAKSGQSQRTGRAQNRLFWQGLRPLALVLIALLVGAADAPLALATSTTATATAPTDLSPTDRERRVSKLVSTVIERQHYRQSAINDQVSTLVLDDYIAALDGQRSFFLASDIAEFERYRYQLDDAVLTGALEPVFAIYNRLQVRNRERINQAIESLKTEPDFSVEESFEFDRAKAPWAKTPAELNEIWRKRVKNDALSLLLADKKWPEASEMLRKRYERVLKRTQQTNADDIFDVFMNSFAHVFDPHSNYLSPRNSEEFRIAMSLSYVGIGASLQMVDDYVTIMNLLAGGPAATSGLINTNDRITAVGEGKDGKLVDVIGWRLDDVVDRIRGKAETVVRLQVLPAGAAPGSPEKILSFARNTIQMESYAAKKEVRKVRRGEVDHTIGIVTVPSFYQDFEARAKGNQDYRSTTRDVRKLIRDLKADGIESLVLDLRGDGGGNLFEAASLTGLFIPKGPVVQVRETGGHIEVLDDPEPDVAWDGPLIVLVDRLSASASEIFAGAIQDYGRGLIVGQQTYGKGSVQTALPLSRYAMGPDSESFGQLTFTSGKFYRVTGESTQHRGVLPDITLPSAIDSKEVGESTQDHALAWDRIPSVPFGKDSALKQAVAPLTQAHEKRVLEDADFQLLVKDIGIYETTRSQKTTSLNLKTRQAERSLLEQQRVSNENTRRKQTGLPPIKALTELATNDQRDAILSETAQIALDLTGWNKQSLVKVQDVAPIQNSLSSDSRAKMRTNAQ
jgi:carboxyl-terminal processing protease